MEKRIKFKKIDLVYSDQGEGNCLVLLHGYLESRKVWESFTGRFPAGFRFIVPDLPGHGASGSWGKVHPMDELAMAVKAILDAEGIKKVFLAGHSMGGYVTMAFAHLFPEYLSAYALVHSTPFADSEEKKENRKREISLVLCGKKRQIVQVNIPKAFAAENLQKMSKQVELLKNMAMRSPDEGMVALLNGMMERPDRSATLKDPKLPLLLVGGMNDNYIPVEVFDQLVAMAPHARVLRLENSGHQGFMEEAEPLITAITAFLSSIK